MSFDLIFTIVIVGVFIIFGYKNINEANSLKKNNLIYEIKREEVEAKREELTKELNLLTYKYTKGCIFMAIGVVMGVCYLFFTATNNGLYIEDIEKSYQAGFEDCYDAYSEYDFEVWSESNHHLAIEHLDNYIINYYPQFQEGYFDE